MATARSMSSTGVTQTGQPGPWTRDTPGGKSESRPKRTMVWVWPPQTSMSVQGRVVISAKALANPRTAAASRYSSTNLT